jgi:hypothetical protein
VLALALGACRLSEAFFVLRALKAQYDPKGLFFDQPGWDKLGFLGVNRSPPQSDYGSMRVDRIASLTLMVGSCSFLSRPTEGQSMPDNPDIAGPHADRYGHPEGVNLTTLMPGIYDHVVAAASL